MLKKGLAVNWEAKVKVHLILSDSHVGEERGPLCRATDSPLLRHDLRTMLSLSEAVMASLAYTQCSFIPTTQLAHFPVLLSAHPPFFIDNYIEQFLLQHTQRQVHTHKHRIKTRYLDINKRGAEPAQDGFIYK